MEGQSDHVPGQYEYQVADGGEQGSHGGGADHWTGVDVKRRAAGRAPDRGDDGTVDPGVDVLAQQRPQNDEGCDVGNERRNEGYGRQPEPGSPRGSAAGPREQRDGRQYRQRVQSKVVDSFNRSDLSHPDTLAAFDIYRQQMVY